MTAPTTLADIQDVIARAVDRQRPLEITAGATKRWYGRAVEGDPEPLSLAGLRGVADYQPRELICVVRPGTPLAELEDVLASEGQMLAFEPPRWGAGATVGGALACNLAGPRRFRSGAARDHLLGFQAVTGRGESVRGGGRVVKNVTGYDLSKLMCGSFGTLGLLTEVCLKVWPRGEVERTVAVPGLGDGDGLRLLIEAVKSPHDVTGAAHLPAGAPLPEPLERLGGAAGRSWTLLRLEGTEGSVAYRADHVAALAGEAPRERIDADDSRALWAAVREKAPLVPGEAEALWRVSLPPTRAAGLAATLHDTHGARAWLADWGGGLVWAVLPLAADGPAVHAAAARAGGHARVVRAGGPLPPETPVFTPLERGKWRLQQSLKAAFDPAGVLNPGRMYPGL